MTTTATATADLGTILGVWAHPDDEAYLSAAVMATARDRGQRVVCVTATRGERGTPDPVAWPPDRLAAERTRELARCLGILGVVEHEWLDHPDGGCAAADAGAGTARIAAIVDRVRPDTVLTFGPDGLTGHEDHRTVSAWATAAFHRAAPPGARLLYATLAPPRHARWGALAEGLGVYEPGHPVLTPQERLAVDLSPDPALARRKFRALAAQRTQTAGLIAHLGAEVYTAWAGDEQFVEAARRPAPAAARPAAGVTTG